MFDESKAGAVAAVLMWFSTRSNVNVYLHPNVGGYSQIINTGQYNLLCNIQKDTTPPPDTNLELVLFCSTLLLLGDLSLLRAEQLVTECTCEQE